MYIKTYHNQYIQLEINPYPIHERFKFKFPQLDIFKTNNAKVP